MVLTWLILALLAINATHSDYSTPASIHGRETAMLIEPPFSNINWYTAPTAEQALPVVPNFLPYVEGNAFQMFQQRIYGMVPSDNPAMFGTYNEHQYPIQAPSYFFHSSARYPVRHIVPNLLSHGETSACRRISRHTDGITHHDREESVLRQFGYMLHQQRSHVHEMSDPEAQLWQRPVYEQDNIPLSRNHQNFRNVNQHTPTVDESVNFDDIFKTIYKIQEFFQEFQPETLSGQHNPPAILPAHSAISTSATTEVDEALRLPEIAPGYDTHKNGENATSQCINVAAPSLILSQDEKKVQFQHEMRSGTATAGSSFWRSWESVKQGNFPIQSFPNRPFEQQVDNPSQESLMDHEQMNDSMAMLSTPGHTFNVSDSVQSPADYSGQLVMMEALKDPKSAFNGSVKNGTALSKNKQTQTDLCDEISDTKTTSLSIANVSLDLHPIMLKKSVGVHLSEAANNSPAAHIIQPMIGSGSSVSEKAEAVGWHLEYTGFVPMIKQHEQMQLSEQSTVTAVETSEELPMPLLHLSPEQSAHLASNRTVHVTQIPASRCYSLRRSALKNISSSSKKPSRKEIFNAKVELCSSRKHNATFTRNAITARSKRIQTDEKGYARRQCNRPSNRKSSLDRHMRIHAGDKTYACHLCNRSFKRKLDIKRHVRIHTGEKPYACNHCNRSFCDKGNLNQHIRTHTGEKPYVCNHCNRSFTQKANLNQHIRTHTGDKPYACDLCNRSFSGKGDLNRHTLIHTGKKPYACNQCNLSFNLKGTLKRHALVHTGEKPYACKQCNRLFSQKGTLSIHTLIHTGKKPYACNQCNRSFSEKGDLNRHTLIHTGNKPYACNQCNHSFSGKGDLNRHIRTHTGEKPYACHHCNRSFSVKENLKKHIVRIHPVRRA